MLHRAMILLGAAALVAGLPAPSGARTAQPSPPTGPRSIPAWDGDILIYAAGGVGLLVAGWLLTAWAARRRREAGRCSREP